MADKDQIDEQNRQVERMAGDVGVEDVSSDRDRGRSEGGERGEPAQREAPAEPTVGSKFADKRQSLYERAKELRGEQQKIRDEAVVDIDDRLSDFRRPSERSEGDEPQAQPRRHKLTVNGQEFELSEEEVLANAQKAIAAGDILEHAKRARAEAMQGLEALRAAQATPAARSEEPKSEKRKEAATPAEPTDGDLDDIVERIQLGDVKDAKAALTQFGDRIVERMEQRIGNLSDTIADTMQVVEQNRSRQTQTQETLAEFSHDYPEFSDDILRPALAMSATQKMRAEMLKAGVQEQTLENLRASNGWNEIETVGNAYRSLLEKGYDLLPHKEILAGAAKTIREKFGVSERSLNPAPTPERRSERDERKDRLGQQPRRATAPNASERRELSRTETQKRALMQMKASRKGRVV